MGKPYASELEKIPDTYQWAKELDISELKKSIRSNLNVPFISIGSGGSLTAASLATLLHQEAGTLAKNITPLEFVSSREQYRDSCILFLTAGGRNSDILNSYKHALELEPKQVIGLCTRLNSPMKKISQEYKYSKFFEFNLPTGKDGFIATNSLMAITTILCRAWQGLGNNKYALPPELGVDIESKISIDEKYLNRDVWIVLYDWWGFPAAIDLESRFTEAGISCIQLADYRNFAHGRHNWLSKHKEETGIISLISPTTTIAQKTLDLIPEQIPKIELSTQDIGGIGTLDLILQSMFLVKKFGEDRDIDPGRPRVPQYGRKLYHLRIVNIPSATLALKLSSPERIAIEKKIRNISRLDKLELKFWKNKYHNFISNLKKGKFGAILFDYDGTLCAPEERFSHPSNEIVSKLNELIENNIIIGIATGRGKSVRTALQKVIPKERWNSIIIGYYNGGTISELSDSRQQLYSTHHHNSLTVLDKLLHSNPFFDQIASTELRERQLTVIPHKNEDWLATKRIITNTLSKIERNETKIVESSHSLDIIMNDVSKLNLLRKIEKQFSIQKKNYKILCIGDKGEWPGNDHELLATPFSLSVDSVSLDPDTCWNLAPPGHKGTQATLDYLDCLIIRHSFFSFDMKKNR